MLTGTTGKPKARKKVVAYVKPESKNFIDLFQERVESNPNYSIVFAENESLTYSELDRKSDRLANYLRINGIKKGNLVGLCISLSADFIVCMLAILKSGAVYFPLDPHYPSERLKYMLGDAKPSAILVEPQFAHLFQNSNIVNIDKKTFEFDHSPAIVFDKVVLHPEDLAYVIYTSGSTGKPKGIMVTHKSLPNIALAHNGFYPSNMRMLVSGGVCFDASLLVIFHALINNEPLYLFNYSPRDEIQGLLDFIEANSIQFLICVPSQYSRILQKKQKLHLLKCVSLTGENLPSSLCELHAQLSPNAILYNEYGPTECAIGTTIAKVYDPQQQSVGRVTAGKPLPNTQVYILDQNLNNLPKGKKGEICVGGIGLAQGYLNKAELTADKFVWIEISGKKPMRLYRTGDIGRFLPNGNLEFLGRADQNAKILGHLVSIGEIEYHISRCREVQESAVLIEPDSKGKKQLVAYVTSKKATVQSFLHKYLKGLLPQYMVPSRIIQVNKFPMSPNGKIDRDALVSFRG